MQILSHRGLWREPAEKNTLDALARSFQLGFGTETDLRDCLGDLVVSHDPPAGSEPRWAQVLALPQAARWPLALNIKADGLAGPLRAAMGDVPPSNWFVFDMSVPDMRAHLRAGNPVFTRLSEAEPRAVWFEQAAGVWLDGFDGIWFDQALVRGLLDQGKRVCCVSPELHGREPGGLWNLLAGLRDVRGLMLCTDRPEEATAFMGASAQ